jgi:hypothetical protein
MATRCSLHVPKCGSAIAGVNLCRLPRLSWVMPYLRRHPRRLGLLVLPLLAGLASAPPVAAQGTRPDPAFLTPDQVSTVLRARGYSELSGVEREGDSFRIPQAMRYGEKVENLRIDALTGQPREEQPLSEAQARVLLRDRGYDEVTELGREGDIIRLRAVRNGTPSELRVDARTGTVRQ